MPSIVALGCFAPRRARGFARGALQVRSASAILSTTPPASVLCRISGDRILATTGKADAAFCSGFVNDFGSSRVGNASASKDAARAVFVDLRAGEASSSAVPREATALSRGRLLDRRRPVAPCADRVGARLPACGSRRCRLRQQLERRFGMRRGERRERLAVRCRLRSAARSRPRAGTAPSCRRPRAPGRNGRRRAAR